MCASMYVNECVFYFLFSFRLLTQAAGIASDMNQIEEGIDLMEKAWLGLNFPLWIY